MRHRLEPIVLTRKQQKVLKSLRPKGTPIRVRPHPKPNKAQKKAMRKAINRFRYGTNNGSDMERR